MTINTKIKFKQPPPTEFIYIYVICIYTINVCVCLNPVPKKKHKTNPKTNYTKIVKSKIFWELFLSHVQLFDTIFCVKDGNFSMRFFFASSEQENRTESQISQPMVFTFGKTGTKVENIWK